MSNKEKELESISDKQDALAERLQKITKKLSDINGDNCRHKSKRKHTKDSYTQIEEDI